MPGLMREAGARLGKGKISLKYPVFNFTPQFLGVSYLGRAYELVLRWKTIGIPSEASEKQYRYYFL